MKVEVEVEVAIPSDRGKEAMDALAKDLDRIRAYRDGCRIAGGLVGDPASVLAEVERLLEFVEIRIETIISEVQAVLDGGDGKLLEEIKSPGDSGGK